MEGQYDETKRKYNMSLIDEYSPGSSSMIGLFQVCRARNQTHLQPLKQFFFVQEHGPCRITNDSSSVNLNLYSWNNAANMLYIDQPVGVGFSYGQETVGTSGEAAADIWTFMQIFLKDSRFQKYANSSLGIFTESYGGHYGYYPVFF